MAFIEQSKAFEIKKCMTNDHLFLKKLYNSKKSDYNIISVDHNMVNTYLENGWEEFTKPLKTKTKLRKKKEHGIQFEHDIWCQFYNLGYRNLNIDENFVIHYNYFVENEKVEESKQIDVVAINSETAILIECKSSELPKKAPSYKDEFELLGLRIDGFKKAIHQVFGSELKVKFIFATRNLRLDFKSTDMERLKSARAFYYNNNTFKYVNNLISKYKNAAIYQFSGLLFKNEIISIEKIEIPAIQGDMGNKKYYMFSIEPSLLLKMGFILHRTKVNESEFPTYQRLLVPRRLDNITKFIDNGGFFPNSIIVNFNSQKNKIQFVPGQKVSHSNSKLGTLKIPNSYGIAYIIDGQHRVYGYANSKFKTKNTIPVVAFDNLHTSEQLKIFMDINENQKAVSPTLRIDLEEDLYWNSDRADSRLKALRSSIAKQLSSSQSGPLFEKISVGEDKSLLSLKPFTTAISASGLLPAAAYNKYKEGTTEAALYNVNNQNHNDEMDSTKEKTVQLINLSYELVEQYYPEIFNANPSFIVSNRGTYAFICLIGSLNKFCVEQGILTKKSSSKCRFLEIKPFLTSLLDSLKNLSNKDREKQLSLLGAGADIKWLRQFQSLINSKHPEYYPSELIDWNERQDEDLQNEGRRLGVSIEKRMKNLVLQNLKILFSDTWELEINSVKRECQDRAEKEMEKFYKEFKKKKTVDWTEMFNINDYKTIIEKYWTTSPENSNNEFKSFEKLFALDIGLGFNSKKEQTKWIALFNSYRNLWAHEGSKEKRLNKDEVGKLALMYNHFEKEKLTHNKTYR